MYEKLDELHEVGDAQKEFDAAKELFDSDPENQKNVELLWRYARACNALSSAIRGDNEKKKKIITEGLKYVQEAYKIDSNNFDVIKFLAILTGGLTSFLSIKERIQQGIAFKEYLDKALSMKPREITLLHMRGRFSFSVASLTWIERKAASAFFATPPQASFDEAIVDFLEVEKLNPKAWMQNLFYLSKSYISNNDKKSAVKYLDILIKLHPSNESDKEVLSEACLLHSKYAK